MANRPLTRKEWTAYLEKACDEFDWEGANKQGWDDGVMAERQRIVNLLMIQHEAAKGAHNYWHVAAQLIQADVASDT